MENQPEPIQNNPEPSSQVRPSWKDRFERHPYLTLVISLLGTLIFFIFITEHLLTYKVTSLRYRAAATRYISLKEYPPGEIRPLAPLPGAHEIKANVNRDNDLLAIDAQGFIRPSQIHDHPEVVLAFLGGATTECLKVPELSRFPYLTGRIIEQETGLRVNSYNAGKSLNNSLHSLNILLNKILPLKPDIVVVMHNLNDLTTLICDQSYWSQDTLSSPLTVNKPGLVNGLAQALRIGAQRLIPHLFWELQNNWRWFTERPPHSSELRTGAADPKVLDQTSLVGRFKKNLQTFINICRARRITPILMTEPQRLTDIGATGADHRPQLPDVGELFTRFNQAIREVGADNEVRVIDLALQVPTAPEYLDDLGNVTEQGAKTMAKIIATDLKVLILNKK